MFTHGLPSVFLPSGRSRVIPLHDKLVVDLVINKIYIYFYLSSVSCSGKCTEPGENLSFTAQPGLVIGVWRVEGQPCNLRYLIPLQGDSSRNELNVWSARSVFTENWRNPWGVGKKHISYRLTPGTREWEEISLWWLCFRMWHSWAGLPLWLSW